MAQTTRPATRPATRQATRWWWIRHGPVLNPDRRLYGQGDLECHFPDAGAVPALAWALPDDAVWFASHLRRTHQTAAALAAALRAQGKAPPAPLHHADLAEQHFGDCQGMTFAELAALGTAFDRLWNEPGATRPPGGESFADVIARVGTRIRALNDAHAGQDIVAVAHGGTIRAALALALGLDAHAALGFRIDTLSLTRIDFVPPGMERTPGSLTRWRVETVNWRPAAHLASRV